MKQSNIKQPPCEACLQRSISQLKSAAFKYCEITEPLKNKNGCDEGLLAMRIIAGEIESVLHEKPTTPSSGLAFIDNFWDTPRDVSDAYVSFATAIIDAVKLIHNHSQSKESTHG